MPDSEFRRLMKYSFSSEILESSKAPKAPILPEEEIFYPVTSFPQEADIYILSPDGQYILFGFDKKPVSS